VGADRDLSPSTALDGSLMSVLELIWGKWLVDPREAIRTLRVWIDEKGRAVKKKKGVKDPARYQGTVR